MAGGDVKTLEIGNREDAPSLRELGSKMKMRSLCYRTGANIRFLTGPVVTKQLIVRLWTK